MSEWRRVKLLECCQSIAAGDHQPPPKAETGIPFVTISNMTSTNQFDFSDTLFVPQDYYDGLDDKRKAKKNDILYSVVGSFGIPVFMKEDKEFVFQRHIAILRPNEEEIVPRFLFYTMLTRDFYAKADAAALGAAQRTVSLTALRNMEIDIPAKEQQGRIVEILSDYDDLVENNQKQIRLLEEAAQRLYKEWFVDLHFPGYEDVRIVDGVPEGWKRISVNDCLDMSMNGGWGKENPTAKNTHPGRVIRGTDINDVKAGRFAEIPLRYHTDNDISRRVLKEGDIVFELSNGNINNIGRCLFIDDLILENCGENTICASFCKLLRPTDKKHGLVLYWEIQSMQVDGRMTPFKKQGSNGINNFAFEEFLEHKLLVPESPELLKPIEGIMSKISNIQRQFAIITEARDRMLPKLMTGELM